MARACAGADSLLVLLVGAVVAIVSPARGIPDRLAGTWIVPRRSTRIVSGLVLAAF
jgi:hypothetical protein